MPQPRRAEAASTDAGERAQDIGTYYVVAVGVSYSVAGEPGSTGLGLQGRTIDLDDQEATRLLKLGVVRAATDEEVEASRAREARDLEIAAENAAGPATNPFGGQLATGTTLEEHAAEQIKLARQAAKA